MTFYYGKGEGPFISDPVDGHKGEVNEGRDQLLLIDGHVGTNGGFEVLNFREKDEKGKGKVQEVEVDGDDIEVSDEDEEMDEDGNSGEAKNDYADFAEDDI